ncbi:MAG TPA: hydroxyacid dehydrogenase [Roseimicrobium sp.]|nr:hydroxyacid dehydrogenase [Roseimicrobium sp.]
MIAPPLTGESLMRKPDLLNEVEVIFSGWGGPCCDERFFDLTPNMRAVFHAGGAQASVPANAYERGVVMTSAHIANSIPVAEYSLATILFSLKHGWHLIQRTKTARTFPDRNQAPGSYGSTVGLVSMGAIARILRVLLEPFDLQVLASDPFLTPAEADDLDVTLASLDDIFAQSHVVSLHTPHMRETEGMITGQHLMSMRPGATFINTARGGVVRQAELIEVAKQRPDLQFVLDVTFPEPPDRESPLYDLPNVVLTPHIAGSAGGECRRMGQYLVEELERYIAGDRLQWAIPARPSAKRPLSPSLIRSRRVSEKSKSGNVSIFRPQSVA